MLGESHGRWYEAGKALTTYVDILQDAPPDVSLPDYQRLVECQNVHLAILPTLPVPYVPKHHLWTHVTSRRLDNYDRAHVGWA